MALPPHRRTNVFIATEDRVTATDVTFIYKGEAYNLEDKNVVRFSWINYSQLVGPIFVFVMYFAFSVFWEKKLGEIQSKLDGVGAKNDAVNKKLDEASAELDAARQKYNEEMGKLRSAQYKIKLFSFRRLEELGREVQMWRRMFEAIYQSAFSSKSEAQKALTALLKKVGINPTRRLDEYSESTFMEMLLDPEFHEKAERTP